MFEDLRDAFREAVENFNKELHRDQVPRTVDDLLAGMTNELAEETAQVRGLEAELEKTTATSQREKDAAATCRRREQMARDIGDEETAKLAAQHAGKHQGHHIVLEKKLEALREELAFRRQSAEEMTAQLADARKKRGSLGATAGRTGARQALSDADDLFSELDRMAEKMEGGRQHAEAAQDLDALDLGGAEPADYDVGMDDPLDPAPPPPSREERDVDAALAELTRRMGRG
jgi:phage shock protein A